MTTTELKKIGLFAKMSDGDDDDESGSDDSYFGNKDEKEDFEKELGENMDEDENELELDDEDFIEETEE
ncbi:hypothetical protein M1506_02015 [Patescibacteria group bacterium]|nr:hypothetical protein [Patescibacteria group bacterium]